MKLLAAFLIAKALAEVVYTTIEETEEGVAIPMATTFVTTTSSIGKSVFVLPKGTASVAENPLSSIDMKATGTSNCLAPASTGMYWTTVYSVCTDCFSGLAIHPLGGNSISVGAVPTASCNCHGNATVVQTVTESVIQTATTFSLFSLPPANTTSVLTASVTTPLQYGLPTMTRSTNFERKILPTSSQLLTQFILPSISTSTMLPVQVTAAPINLTTPNAIVTLTVKTNRGCRVITTCDGLASTTHTVTTVTVPRVLVTTRTSASTTLMRATVVTSTALQTTQTPFQATITLTSKDSQPTATSLITTSEIFIINNELKVVTKTIPATTQTAAMSTVTMTKGCNCMPL